jgi:hypothetical protein
MLGCESRPDHWSTGEKITPAPWNKAARQLLSRRSTNHQSRLLKASALHYLAANPTEELP